MEELRDDVITVIVIRRSGRALSVRLLGGVKVPLSSLAKLSSQSFEQVLTIVEAAVIGHVHGHPESGGGQLIMQNLEHKVTEYYLYLTLSCFRLLQLNFMLKAH